MGVVLIPQSYMGQTLQETDIKRVLIEMNPGFHFDVGGNLDIWHPYQERRQGVWHEGKHLVAMDRATIPEFPIWSMKEELVPVPTHTLRWADILDPFTLEEFVEIDGKQQLTGMSSVKKQVRDKIILVGWRHTLEGVLNGAISGVTKAGIEAQLRICMDWKPEKGSLETTDPKITDQTVAVA